MKLLAWTDSATAGTGFGKVAYHVLRGLHETGHYDIDQLGINYHGEFYDRTQIPWHIAPAQLLDPKDPHGRLTFLEHIKSGRYDVVWILNDCAVLEGIAAKLGAVLDDLSRRGSKRPKIVYYFPVDGPLFHSIVSMHRVADVVVAYSKYGVAESLRFVPELEGKIKVIPHGVERVDFFPLQPEQRTAVRRQYMGIDSDTFLWININRSNLRKQLTHSILCFAEFRKQHPNSKLYLHAPRQDRFTGVDLDVAIEQAGLPREGAVVLPTDYNPARPLPVEVMNQIYNSADCFITTSLGEGWGLTHIEALSAGVPVVVPNNSVFPEQLGDGDLGYIYPCRERLWIDNAGYRPVGLKDDVVATMDKAYSEITKFQGTGRPRIEFPKVAAAQEYLNSLSWDCIVRQWLTVMES